MKRGRTVAGDLLYRELPVEYRHRDNGDLECYLHGYGELLDRLRNTLEQLYADAFAEAADDGRAAQEWLLPYLGDLLAVELRSPLAGGRRAELNEAVRLRQRKGAVSAIDRIAEVVAQVDVVVQEGWRRVLTTPRPGAPLLPHAYFTGTSHALDQALAEGRSPLQVDPQENARHAGLPRGTIDLRTVSRAIESPIDGPTVEPITLTSDHEGGPAPRRRALVRNTDPRGAPLFRDTFEDVSLRTPDLRTPDPRRVGARTGLHHPRRVVVYLRPPYGLIEPGLPRLVAGAGFPDVPELVPDDDGFLRHVDATKLVIEGDITVLAGQHLQFRDLIFEGEIHVRAGGLLTLRRCATRRIRVTGGEQEVRVAAHDCLLETLQGGVVLLEYVTVLGDAQVRRLLASDCIFNGALAITDGAAPSCVRYSRLPAGAAVPGQPQPMEGTNTGLPASFYAFPFRLPGDGLERRPAAFGEPGCGVLDPETLPAIASGAEAAGTAPGELGAHHHLHHMAVLKAVAAKLEDNSPIGLETILRYDHRLLFAPPRPSA